MPRNPQEKCNVSWEARYGTTATGNLPRHKASEDTIYTVSGTVYSGVDPTLSGIMTGVEWRDFHTYHIKCPYSTQSDFQYVRNTNPFESSYMEMYTVSGVAVDHTHTEGLMIRWHRGSKYGWLCVDNDCPYYQGTVSGSVAGTRYFYS